MDANFAQKRSNYLDALIMFRHLLEQFTLIRCLATEAAIVASPPWRSKFECPTDSPNKGFLVRLKSGVELTEREVEFFELLSILRRDQNGSTLTRSINLADEIHRLLQKRPELSSTITPYVAKSLGDLSIVMQCLCLFNRCQPLAEICEREAYWKNRIDDLREEFILRTLPMKSMMDLAADRSKDNLVPYRKVTETDLLYPIGQRRTRANIDAMRLAESRLDSFWKSIERMMSVKVEGWYLTAVRKLLMEPHTLRRTPEWIETEGSAAAKAGKKGNLESELPFQSLSEMYLDLQRRTERTVDKTEAYSRIDSKTKTKPRNGHKIQEAANDNDTDAAQVGDVAVLDPPEEEQPERIAVNDRALKVFKTIFFTPSTTTTPGEVSWKDFLHAMTSAGFETRKLQGSMWQFTPTKTTAERSIIFHEPHPNPKIAYAIARRHGRRLNRAYGWDASTFVLESK